MSEFSENMLASMPHEVREQAVKVKAALDDYRKSSDLLDETSELFRIQDARHKLAEEYLKREERIYKKILKDVK